MHPVIFTDIDVSFIYGHSKLLLDGFNMYKFLRTLVDVVCIWF